jgi:hypothetical protein
LVHVAELAADPEHLVGRSQDLQDLIPALVRLEQHRTTEGCVLVKQLASLIDVPLFDGGAEAIREHRPQPNARRLLTPKRRAAPSKANAAAPSCAGARRRSTVCRARHVTSLTI